jgi:RNA polymerase sigma-70 factor (ECF subfamily)
MTFGKSLTLTEDDLGSTAAVEAARPESERPAFLDKLRSGDENAFEELVSRYSGEVYGLLYRLTSNSEEASDLTQDTFLKALAAVRKFRGESSLRTWLFRIAINESRNRQRWWKRRNRDTTISLDSAIGNSEMTVAETVADASENAESAAIRREREQALEAALLELPDIFREAVILRDVEGLSYEESAAALGTTLGTVKSRIARGREELRRRLRGY